MSLATVRDRIRAACLRSGRDPDGVRLVAVTKGHDADEIRTRILAHGIVDLGENRVQEWRDKAAELEGVRWHFVGGLQRNKVKYLARAGVAFVHSLNSERLADELNAQGERHDHTFRAFIEVDVAGEEAKQGVPPDRVEALLDHAASLDRVEVVGLMAMAPFTSDPEATRPTFARLRELRGRLGLRELSMGMSRDLEIAVEEGATLLRIGTALFEGPATDEEAGTRATSHAVAPNGRIP